MGSKADVFVMIPVHGAFQHTKEEAPDGAVGEFLRQMAATSHYECSSRIADTLERFCLGSVEMAYTDDEYDMTRAEWIKAVLVLTHQAGTGLGVLQLILPSCDKDLTQMGDIVSTGHLRLRQGGKEYALTDYLRQRHGLKQCGKCRCIYCLPMDAKDDAELEYLLAGEAMNSEHSAYKMENQLIRERARTDISVYDFYELYASQSSLVYYTREFSDQFIDNIEEEVLLIFICEIAILQNTAIARINDQIVDELMENSDISTKQTLKLQVEFGKTIVLWEKNVYNYENVQMLSNQIIEAFGTAELFEEYQRNKEHLEQIASLKSGIAAELEGKVLNILAFILSVAELVQLGRVVVDFLMGTSTPQYWIAGGAGTFLVLLLLLHYRLRRQKQRNRKK